MLFLHHGFLIRIKPKGSRFRYKMIKHSLFSSTLFLYIFVVYDFSSVYIPLLCFMVFSAAAVEASVVALAIPLSYVALVSSGFGDPAQLFSAELLGGFAIRVLAVANHLWKKYIYNAFLFQPVKTNLYGVWMELEVTMPAWIHNLSSFFCVFGM